MKQRAASGVAVLERDWAPKQRRSLYQWLCEEAWLDPTSARPGRWKPDMVPWAREIIDALDPDSGVQRISVMKCGQASITTLMVLAAAYYTTEAPRSLALIWPTIDLCHSNVQERLRPMFEAIPSLADLFDFGPRSADITASRWKFPGGIGYIKPGNRRGLVNFSAPVLLLDEVAKFQAAQDGDAITRSRRACITYPDSKIFEGSTPDQAGSCPMVAAHAEGDRRVWKVPCPSCGHEHELVWENMHYPPNRPEEAFMVCPSCDAHITQKQKFDVVSAGRWVVTHPDARYRSYHVSGFMSLLLPWSAIAQEYESARGDYSREIVWRKEWLGLPALPMGGVVMSPEELMERSEAKLELGTCPDEALVLTAGVDVQGNRLEMFVWGWADQRESWLVDIVVIPGNPEGRAIWQQLHDAIQRRYKTPYGQERLISLTCIDTGYLTDHVYSSAGRWPRVRLIKGRSAGTATGQIIFPPQRMDLTKKGRRFKGGVMVSGLNVHALKESFYAGLRSKPGDRGYVHLPSIDKEIARGLLGEQQILKVGTGGETKWVFERVKGRRNEPLDCACYALAAHRMLGLHRWPVDRWQGLRKRPQLSVLAPAMPVREKPEGAAPEAPAREPRRGNPFSFRNNRFDQGQLFR